MPRNCSAGGCKSRDSRDTRNAGITFHKLPRQETRRNLWITNSQRAESWVPQSNFVYFCSKHFTPESFELTGCSGVRRLKEDAFPTIFDCSSTTKCQRSRKVKRKEDNPVRKNSKQNPHLTVNGQLPKEATAQISVAAAEETVENAHAFSPELSGVEQRSLREDGPPTPVSRPLSPSHYMKRLPPPPGFYLSKEHNYAQLCPLLWRRRYNQAIDCLEKALRQLHAARRRENRLRSTVLRLRDKRLKQALLGSQDGFKNRGIGATSADPGMFEDRCVNRMELGRRFFPNPNSWVDEKGCCFYCGRGLVQVGHQKVHTGLNSQRDVQPTEQEDSLEFHTSLDVDENTKDMKTNSVETSDSCKTNSKVTAPLKHVIPAETPEQCVLSLSCHQKELLSDMCKETEAVSPEHQQDLWTVVQDSGEQQLILLPPPAADVLQSICKMEGLTDETQTILVSELDFQGENSGADVRHSEQNVAINSHCVEVRDVREKLKEHLEGFHLQLSTDFLN